MSVGEFIERFALVGAWIAVVVVFSALKPHTFATSSNFAAILGSQAVLVVLTCALLIPLTAGDYDLSITGVLTLSQMMIGILNTEHGISVYVCIVVALPCAFSTVADTFAALKAASRYGLSNS